MKRTLIAAAILALFLGIAPILNLIDGLRPFDRPALTCQPCETVFWAGIAPLDLDFEGQTGRIRAHRGRIACVLQPA